MANFSNRPMIVRDLNNGYLMTKGAFGCDTQNRELVGFTVDDILSAEMPDFKIKFTAKPKGFNVNMQSVSLRYQVGRAMMLLSTGLWQAKKVSDTEYRLRNAAGRILRVTDGPADTYTVPRTVEADGKVKLVYDMEVSTHIPTVEYFAGNHPKYGNPVWKKDSITGNVYSAVNKTRRANPLSAWTMYHILSRILTEQKVALVTEDGKATKEINADILNGYRSNLWNAAGYTDRFPMDVRRVTEDENGLFWYNGLYTTQLVLDGVSAEDLRAAINAHA